MITKKHKIALVEWMDSCADGGWHDPRKTEHNVSHCTSVGFLEKKTKKEVTLFQSKSDIGNINEAITIPRSVVKKIIILAEPDK